MEPVWIGGCLVDGAYGVLQVLLFQELLVMRQEAGEQLPNHSSQGLGFVCLGLVGKTELRHLRAQCVDVQSYPSWFVILFYDCISYYFSILDEAVSININKSLCPGEPLIGSLVFPCLLCNPVTYEKLAAMRDLNADDMRINETHSG